MWYCRLRSMFLWKIVHTEHFWHRILCLQKILLLIGGWLCGKPYVVRLLSMIWLPLTMGLWCFTVNAREFPCPLNGKVIGCSLEMYHEKLYMRTIIRNIWKLRCLLTIQSLPVEVLVTFGSVLFTHLRLNDIMHGTSNKIIAQWYYGFSYCYVHTLVRVMVIITLQG